MLVKTPVYCVKCVWLPCHILTMSLRSTGNHFGLADFQRNNYLRWTAMGKGVSKDLQILTRSRLERILIDVMRGSWQPQGPEVWKGRDNRSLPVSWQPRLGARQPGHSPDWWAPGPELQTYRPTHTHPSPSPYPIPYPGRVQPVRHEPSLTALCPHNHRQWLPVTPPRMDGQALIRLTRWEGELFYFTSMRACVRKHAGHLSNYSVLSCIFVQSESLFECVH